ncbi:TPA: MBL fold metallo-hydrolase [Candidatus Woesearchaeota archaeon]|nr:Metal-dependent hydrolases of the beta-lactamase superfamily I [archaeon GW2011_AR15]MBS3104554.1 MBL fold metallo-hydrolase [Candidatus Woesearchaeota archaeon]HIH41132.1 MBL fold metallo-hydrolase [Candidatus Woesearchaeota archaeon]
MRTSVFASGSSGNCTYVETDETSILIDAGISARQIINSLKEIGKDISDIHGVFVTHEHADHISGLERLDRLGIPVFMNKKTHGALPLSIRANFFGNSEFKFREMAITPVSVSHDAADPVGFHIKNKIKSLGVFTDLGKYDGAVERIANNADALVIETNHDIDMVLDGPYPYHLKQRILGDTGHLSNVDAGLLVNENASSRLKTVFLAHISQNNNTHELALNTFTELTRRMRLNRILTNQREMTELIQL